MILIRDYPIYSGDNKVNVIKDSFKFFMIHDSRNLTNFSNNFFKTEKSARITDLKIRIMNIIKGLIKMSFIFPSQSTHGNMRTPRRKTKMCCISTAGKVRNILVATTTFLSVANMRSN